MLDEMRILSRRGALAALLALGSACAPADDPRLSRDEMPVMVSEDAWSEAYVAPEYTEAICQHGWAVISVGGPECAARETFTCEDTWTLASRLEALVSGCGFSPSEEAIELTLSGGCVTGMAFGPNSRANEPALRDCLVGALGSVLAACSDPPGCIRLYGAQPAW